MKIKLCAVTMCAAVAVSGGTLSSEIRAAELVSSDSNGDIGNAYSGEPRVSRDGRYVLFHSNATNLVPGMESEFGSLNIFLKDTATGDISLVTVKEDGSLPTHNDIDRAGVHGVSADGNYVLFSSDSPDITSKDVVGWDHADLFLRNMDTGEIKIINTTSDGEQGTSGWQGTQDAAMTPDAKFVAFISNDPNLVPGGTGQIGNIEHVFRKDTQTDELVLVSVNEAGQHANRSAGERVSISDNGRYIAFASTATNMGGIVNGQYQAVFVKDLVTGEVHLGSAGEDNEAGSRESFHPSLSGNGQYVTFNTQNAYVPEDTNGSSDIYRKDLYSGEIVRVSESTDGGQTNALPYASFYPDISGDGRFVVFQSYDGQLIPNDTNGIMDIFVKDLSTAVIQRVSLSPTGEQVPEGDGIGQHFSDSRISKDGDFIFFTTWNSGVVENDTNNTRDIFKVKNPLAPVKPLTCIFGDDSSYRLVWLPMEGAKGYANELTCDVYTGVDADTAPLVGQMTFKHRVKLDACTENECEAVWTGEEVVNKTAKFVNRKKADGSNTYLACSATVSGNVSGTPRNRPTVRAGCTR